MKKGPGRWQVAWSFGSGLEHIEEAGAATEGSSRGLCPGPWDATGRERGAGVDQRFPSKPTPSSDSQMSSPNTE